MATIQDLKKLKLSKIEEADLANSIREMIADYDKTDDKNFFLKQANQSINQLYRMVEEYAPEAIGDTPPSSSGEPSKQSTQPSSEKESKPTKSRAHSIEVLDNLKDIVETLETAEFVDPDTVEFYNLLILDMEKALSENDDKELEERLKKAFKRYADWEKEMQRKKGSSSTERQKAAKEINKLLEELGMDQVDVPKSSGSSKETDVDLRSFIKDSAEKFKKWNNELKGKDQEHLTEFIGDLIKAQKIKDNEIFKEELRHATNTYRDWDHTISHKTIRNKVSELVKELDRLRRKNIAAPKNEEVENQTTILTEGLIRNVIGELTDVSMDLKGVDETIVQTTIYDLEEALEEKEFARLKKRVVEACENFKEFASDIMDKKGREVRSKRVMDELEKLQPELERCRAVVREAQAKKKEAEGPKPKPTRFTQLKTKLLSLAGIIPPKFKENLGVQEQTKRILLKTHRDLVEAWGMDRKKAQPGADAIEEKFEKIEEKITKKNEN